MAGTFFDGLREVERNLFCDVARAGVAGGLLFAGLTATTGFGAAGGIATSLVSAAAYIAFCGYPPPPDFYGDVPFEGGQCDGVPYRVAISFALILGPMGSNVNVGRVGGVFDAIGPVTIAEAYEDNPTSNDLRVRSVWKGGSGDVSVIKGTNEDPENPQWGMQDIQVLITRTDGLPDLCGDPPRMPPPLRPGDNVFPTNITYNNENNIEVTVPVNLTFGFPRVNIKGEINMPVNVKVDLDIPINFNGDVNFNTGNFTIRVAPPGGNPAGDDDDPPTTTPPGDDPVPPDVPIPPEEPPTDDPLVRKRKIIKAVVVTVVETDTEASIIFQGDNPDIYVPALGYVQFFIRVGTTGGWTSDIPIKNKRNFIPCPWVLGATDVRASPRNNGQLTLRPIYTEESYNPQFPPEAVVP